MPGHGDREDLIGEHPFGDVGQIVLFVIFLVVWIADSFVLKYTTFLSGYLPLYVRIPLGIIVLGIAVYVAKEGHDIVFGEVREPPEIIRKGVFGRVRHPLYFAAILLYWGLILFTLSILSFLVWIVIILFYNFIAKHEEGLLLDKFGIDYEEYMRQVPRWIPRI
jgi:protein-S-isoprenylcysteine O-methyltransferase Ste14